MICLKCRRRIPTRDRHCVYCGASTGKGPSSAALKWGTGLLFAVTAYELLALVLLTIQPHITVEVGVSIVLGRFLLGFGCLSAAIYVLRRKRWLDALLACIILPGLTILSVFLRYWAGLGTLFPPVDVFVVFFAQLVCIILISKAKADFA